MTGSFKIQLINMGTRAAAFQAKLRCLHDYHLRLLHNVVPAPSGVDIANTIKYFSQTFLTVLKDVPNSPHQMIKDPSQDHARMSAYPNLEYGNLYNALAMLLDVAPNIQFGLNVFGKAVLQCLGCILPFLEKDLIDNIPYLVASSISVLPISLHQDIINSLCFFILPFTITRTSSYDDQECHSCQSVSAVIMLVFQYSSNPAHHCQLLECLMALKQNVVKDMLINIAYGTSLSRSSAAKLLFYYWPAFNANLFDRRGLLFKFTNDLIPFVCQRELCPNAGNAEATKVCYDHNIAITYAPDSPPPLYLCIECANEIHRENTNQIFGDILHPMAQVSMICENKNCRSTDKSAISICFSTECASYNGNHPIRYCLQCHGNRHNSRRGGDHIVHKSLSSAWQMEPEMQTYMVEAVISLLREAKPLNFEPGRDASDSRTTFPYHGPPDNISLEERQLLGRYGIWLLVGRCTPTAETPVEILGRLLSMLFHWFHVTAYSSDGEVESTIEKLKVEHVCGWLKDIIKSHYKEFISCLLPHPPEYARNGGHWDTLAFRTSHLKEGLQRLICLVPYEVITAEIWDVVMPYWMEAITNDVPEKELHELKVVISKILDPEMSPLGFDAKTMYNFVSIRFEKTTSKVQEQALHWLQVISKLEILIPLTQLFAMFGNGVRIMKHGVQHEINKSKDKDDGKSQSKDSEIVTQGPRRSSISPVVEDESSHTSDAMSDEEAPNSKNAEFSTDSEHNLTCCIFMLDILLKQIELQDVEQHMGIATAVCENVCRLLKCMVTAARVGVGSHVCAMKVKQVSECAYCEASVMWHQLSVKLVQFICPENPVRSPDPPIEEVIEDEKPLRKSPPDSDKSRDRDISLSMAPLPIPLPLGFGDMWRLPSILDDPGKIIIMAGPVPIAVPQPEPHSVGGVLVHMPHVCSIMTATVETVQEQLDAAAIMPAEKVLPAVARSVTLTENDTALATAQTASKPQLVSAKMESEAFDTIDQSEDAEYESDIDGEDFWYTSVGKFKITLDTLPQSLQYVYQLLIELPNIEKPDILYFMLQCLNVLALNGDALSNAARDHRGFFIWCQENHLIKNLWNLCNAEHSHISSVCVPLLLHCITLPLGSDVFWRIVQEEFHDQDWRIRFAAVERVTVITRFMDATPIRNEVGLQTALATAFCYLIASMDDLNVYVAQRSTLYLGTIHDKAVNSLLFCLESQFDLFIVDRPVVIQSLYQLHNSLSDRRVLSWDFFLNRFDTLFVEAQISLEKTGEIPYLRDLKNSETGSDALLTKISKAREALSQSDTTCSMAKTLSASFGTKWPYKRTMSAPASIIPPRQDSKIEKVYNRQISAPILKRKSSRFGLGQFLSGSGSNANTANVASANVGHAQHHLQISSTPHSHSQGVHHHLHHLYHPMHIAQPQTSSAGTTPTTPNLLSEKQYQSGPTFSNNMMGGQDFHVHSFGGPSEDPYISNCLHRIIDIEESDKETIHLLVFLFMQFMSRSDQAYPTEEKPMARIMMIVMRHLYLLLGYSPIDKMFHITPPRLRCSSVFNAFLSNLPQMLDQNHLMGASILEAILHTLLYCPSTATVASANSESSHNIIYSYSLWRLEPHVRRNWLMAVEVIMYKYEYTQPSYSQNVHHLVRIVLNSLEAQFHRCKRIPATVMMEMPTRSRDMSQPSLSGLGDRDDRDREDPTPPISPFIGSEGTSGMGKGKTTFAQKSAQSFSSRKYQDSSLEADDTESELVAIPESDLSESTLHNSVPGSFDDGAHFDEMATKSEQAKGKVTTANLATAQVALSTLSVVEPKEKEEKEKDTKKPSRLFMKLNSLDKHTKQSSTDSSKIVTKCSVQEGVRMMVTPSIFMSPRPAIDIAATNQPMNVQKAVVVIQDNKAGKDAEPKEAKETKDVSEVDSSTKSAIGSLLTEASTSVAIVMAPTVKPTNPNWVEQKSVSPIPRTLGRQKRIIEPSVTPSTTPVPISTEDVKASSSKPTIKAIDKIAEIGSPESPLSKMSIMPNPLPNTSQAQENLDGLLSPKSVTQLEFPTPEFPNPERLLPIGQHAKDGINTLADKVREVLSIKEISHLKQESSFEKSESTGNDITHSSQANSPRRLMKQSAFESPSNENRSNAYDGTPFATAAGKDAILTQRQRLRKTGPFVVHSQSIPDSRAKYAGSWAPPQYESDSENNYTSAQPTSASGQKQQIPQQPPNKEDKICHRCSDCGVEIEEYSDEEIGIMITILNTFIHREPKLAAPFLPEILTIVSKFASHVKFPWQYENPTHLPGGSQSVAHQFIRCVLHQLAPNGIFVQMFLTQMKDRQRKKYFKSIARALIDFNELNPTSPIHLLVESLNSKKTLPMDTLPATLRNMGEYLSCIPLDVGINLSSWTTIGTGIETLFRRLVLILNNLDNPDYLLNIIVAVLKIPTVKEKSILDPFCKVISHCVQHATLQYKVLNDICCMNARSFSKERDKQQLCRQLMFELVQALKFKTNIPDGNLLLLVGFLLEDSGGTLPPGIVPDLPEHPSLPTTNATDCMRQYLNDCLDFLADFHTLNKIKNFKSSNDLNEDTLGGVLKGAIAQYLALEMSRGNSRDNKAVARYLPWLYNAPSSIQQGPKEFSECIGHMRLLSWLLLGALTHTALMSRKGGNLGQHGASVHYHMQHSAHTVAQPVPQEASCHIADHIQVIFAGFVEQSKLATSVLHMSSLFHAFTLCQLWSVYLEQISYLTAPSTDPHNITMGILIEFWGKVTPCILNLVSSSKVMSEMVNLHFINLLEALKETRCTILTKLLPLWSPVLSSHSQLSATLQQRLKAVRDYEQDLENPDVQQSEALLKFLQKLQFKMGQIELQSSTATQFYSI
ncbi:protein unc-79 homolog isoform X3 [Sitodiplosis mosellana]|uniref:protein unc-79 homolog isoform X3 n=1 Tax=Sitodiplosis mosellana TaxID=263140 RepID=UPI0024451249|nr:protein unc-79 homolog isoform X3 [Sitodiplosis mosellana]